MTLELLICTIDEGIDRLREALLPVRRDVRYLVSWQHTGPRPDVPDWLRGRSDVRVVLLEGRGLSRNRNHALAHAEGDILKICDDDERWTNSYFDNILSVYRQHPEYDIVHFKAIGPRKEYPPRFVSSWEMTLRRAALGSLRFDERFGLGSEVLNAGEEAVFLCDARRLGLRIHYAPLPICQTEPDTTGTQWQSPLLQRSKGAVFCYTRGFPYALYKSVRESLGLMVRKRTNPFPILRNMLWGARYILEWPR